MTKTFEEQSRKNWVPRTENANLEQLQIGCLQRIATSTEKMCLDREKLERDYKHMRNSRDYYRSEAERLQRKLAATKGVVTKLKKKLNA